MDPGPRRVREVLRDRRHEDRRPHEGRVRQLAELRSGLFDYIDDPQWLADLRADPERGYTPRQLLDIAFSHPPTFAPGAKWQYSNTNLVLLGLLVEKVSGQRLGAYLQEHSPHLLRSGHPRHLRLAATTGTCPGTSR
ncbi:serine hydrolase domain-containing protein [Streptomyces sp. NPDC051582]|uniref:serine hydrolase domain-containing protein n=1 Tax=Streptomyces sp. NPDC051582 TaxID=3155167 RepID=UPI0034250D86